MEQLEEKKKELEQIYKNIKDEREKLENDKKEMNELLSKSKI